MNSLIKISPERVEWIVDNPQDVALMCDVMELRAIIVIEERRKEKKSFNHEIAERLQVNVCTM